MRTSPVMAAGLLQLLFSQAPEAWATLGAETPTNPSTAPVTRPASPVLVRIRIPERLRSEPVPISPICVEAGGWVRLLLCRALACLLWAPVPSRLGAPDSRGTRRSSHSLTDSQDLPSQRHGPSLCAVPAFLSACEPGGCDTPALSFLGLLAWGRGPEVLTWVGSCSGPDS